MSDRAAERQKRLRDALRENLKRRKAQSRGRAEDPPASGEEDPMPRPATPAPDPVPSKRRKV